MSHLDDGRLRALIDEELGDADTGAVRLHLEDCDACRYRMVELKGRATLVAQALGQLDTAAPTAGDQRGHGRSLFNRRNFRLQSYLISSFGVEQGQCNDFRHNLHPPLVLLWTGVARPLPRVGRRVRSFPMG